MLPSTIVVGTDGSETASVAVRSAIDLAKVLGASLHVVTACKPAAVSAFAAADPSLLVADGEWREATLREANEVLERAAQWAREAGVGVEGHAVEKGPPEAIISTAEAVHADLIVVGDRGMGGLRRFLTGSVPNAVAHHAPCGVWIVDTSAQLRGR